jgi:HEAT repeat protein
MPAIAVAVGLGCFWLTGCQDPADKLSSLNETERSESLRAVAQRGSEADVDRVAEFAGQDDAVASTAVRCLGTMHHPKAAETLMMLAESAPRPAVREEAVLQLGRVAGPEAIPILEKVLVYDFDPRVRGAAATSLARQNALVDVPVLLDVAETDTDVAVQGRAVGAIEELVGLRFGYDGRASAAKRAEAIKRIRSVAVPAAAALYDRQVLAGRFR